MGRVVTITITYGSPNKASVLNAVMVALSEVVKEGVEPRILQVYYPGSDTIVTVNGRQLRVDESLHERIKEAIYESLIDEDLNDIVNLGIRGVAGAVEE